MLRSVIRLLLPLAALLIAAFVVYAVVSWNEPLDRAEERLTEAAVALQTAAGSGILLDETAAHNGYERVWIVDGSGRIVASSRGAEAGTRIEEPWSGILSGASEPTLFRTEPWGDRLMLFSAHRSAETGRWSAVLEDGSWIGEERGTRLAGAAAVVLSIFVVIGAAAFSSLRRGLFRPLQDLADAASTEKTAPTATIERIAARGTGAIESIATALNSVWTERDVLRRDLNERQALHLAATYLAREMIMVATFEGRIVEVNRSFCRRLSLERDQIVGRPLAALEGVLPASALREMGERSAREQRPFERLLFSFSPQNAESFDVVAAVQAVPFAGEPAFIMVADESSRPEPQGVGELTDDSTSAESGDAATDASQVEDENDKPPQI